MQKMKARKAFMIIKVDLEKAYDKLNWEFISNTLKELQIPNDMILTECIRTSKFNTLWNGSRTKDFNPTRGIRQGDSLCPYIFIICMDKLSHIIA